LIDRRVLAENDTTDAAADLLQPVAEATDFGGEPVGGNHGFRGSHRRLLLEWFGGMGRTGTD
jgi:hypothetical protein